jgi:regulator of cell morphogenesis and NO signaling
MLAELRTLTRDFRAPDDAPAGWTTLYADLAALENALHEHIYLENNVLFARAVGGSDY